MYTYSDLVIKKKGESVDNKMATRQVKRYIAIKDGQYEAPNVYDDINDFIREYSCEYNDEF